MKRKLSLGILLALMLLVLALGVSLAVGLGVFGQFADKNQDARLQNLENFSETYEEETRVEGAGEHFPEVQFTLTQAHYDGQSLYVAYKLSGASVPLIYLDPQGAADVEWDFTPKDDLVTAWDEAVSPTEYEKLRDTLDREGQVFLEVYEQNLGDGASLVDGTYINPSRSDGQMQTDGTWVGYTEFEFPLPESVQNQESITLEFSLLRNSMLYYQDPDGGTYYKVGDRIEPIKLTAVVRRNGENQPLQGQGRFETYAADIAATLSN
ncbi:MAG TPA: hypothetical protein PKE04_22050, partial [Clostridia bacterium]|nr:hypothetical protein [Clostridia bacterium]